MDECLVLNLLLKEKLFELPNEVETDHKTIDITVVFLVRQTNIVVAFVRNVLSTGMFMCYCALSGRRVLLQLAIIDSVLSIFIGLGLIPITVDLAAIPIVVPLVLTVRVLAFVVTLTLHRTSILCFLPDSFQYILMFCSLFFIY